MISLAGLFGGWAQARANEAQARASRNSALLQAEAFEAWLYEAIGERSLDWKEVWTFIHQNSERLERECTWMNHDKRVQERLEERARAYQAPTAPVREPVDSPIKPLGRSHEAKMARHASNYGTGIPSPFVYDQPGRCPFCGTRKSEADKCTICFGEFVG